MSDKTIYLQASTEERMDIPKAALKSLRICICDDQQEPIKSYQVNVFNKKNVYRKCLEINEILDISSKKGESVELYEQLKMKGSSLCDDLLTPEQKKELILLLLPILFGIKYSIIDNSENTVKDEWTSKPVTMAVVFISKDNSLNNEKANILSQSIMMELKSYNRFILLERIDLDIVKSELDLWMSKYTTSEKKMKPDLLQAELLLKIDLTGPDSQNTAHLSNIFISLINAQTGDIKELLNVKLEPGSIIAQRKRISRQLIERLKEEYPRRGIITTVNKQQIMMNIGSNVGVKIGQQYNTLLNQKIILSVESVDLDFSWLKIDPKNKTLFQKGLKINEARFSNFIPANNHSTKKDPLLLIVNRTD
jgi:hypothetical protein